MENSAKDNLVMAAQNGSDLKQPYYIEAADRMFGELMDMGHRDMVQAFNIFSGNYVMPVVIKIKTCNQNLKTMHLM